MKISMKSATTKGTNPNSEGFSGIPAQNMHTMLTNYKTNTSFDIKMNKL